MDVCEFGYIKTHNSFTREFNDDYKIIDQEFIAKIISDI